MKRFSIGSKYEYCPNGNYWSDISGIFDKRIYLFCECNKCNGQVYVLKPFNVTKKINKETLEKARKFNKLEDMRYKITMENMEKVNSFLSTLI